MKVEGEYTKNQTYRTPFTNAVNVPKNVTVLYTLSAVVAVW